MLCYECYVSKEKTQISLILNYRVVGKVMWEEAVKKRLRRGKGGGGESGLNKWNQGNIIEIS